MTLACRIVHELTDIVERDGYLDIEAFVDVVIDQLKLPNWRCKPEAEALIRYALEGLVHEIATADGSGFALLMGERDGEIAYVIKQGAEAGVVAGRARAQ